MWCHGCKAWQKVRVASSHIGMPNGLQEGDVPDGHPPRQLAQTHQLGWRHTREPHAQAGPYLPPSPERILERIAVEPGG